MHQHLTKRCSCNHNKFGVASAKAPSVVETHPARLAATSACQKSTAVVLGSGMAGLLNAHVLSQFFDSVTVLERDDLTPSHAEHRVTCIAQEKAARRGVTQYNHLHVLAGRGLPTIDALFEGRFGSALQSAGAVLNDIVTCFNTFHPASGAWAQPPQAAKGPLLMTQASRHLIESVTRQLLAADGNVQVVYGSDVTGLMLGESCGDEADQQQRPLPAVTGVMLQGGREVAADLVVDCSGRCSCMAQWLSANGLATPRVSEVNASLGYASWLVRLDPEVQQRVLAGQQGMYAVAVYPHTVGGALVRVEDGLYMATVGTYGDENPPFDDAQLPAYVAQKCYSKELGKLLAGSTQVAPASRFYKISSSWRHYEEVQLPEGLLVAGDSVCSLNPIYGHGITVAAMEATRLRELLSQRCNSHNSSSSVVTNAAAGGVGTHWLAGLSQEYQQAIIPIIQNAWELSVGGDVRFETTTSNEPPPSLGGFMNKYLDILCYVAGKDAVVAEALLRVMHLLDEPAALIQPGLLGRAAWHMMTTRLFGRTSATGRALGSSRDGPEPAVAQSGRA